MKVKKKNIRLTQILWLMTTSLLLLSSSVKGQEGEEEIVQYTLRTPNIVHKGETFSVDVLFSVKSDWYIYAPDGSNAAQGMIETKVVLNSSADIKKVGAIKFPGPAFKNGHQVFEGDNIVMSQVFNAGPSVKAGRYEIRGKVIYQTCSSEICLPPVTEEIFAVINVK